MTGPHLTPEREAEIREYVAGEQDAMIAAKAPSGPAWVLIGCAHDLLAALDAERRAHDQARTALEASTELLANLLSTTSTRPSLHWRIQIDERVQENQRVLGLARPATEDA